MPLSFTDIYRTVVSRPQISAKNCNYKDHFPATMKWTLIINVGHPMLIVGCNLMDRVVNLVGLTAASPGLVDILYFKSLQLYN